jgi:integrase/recombinase XerC
MTIAPDPAALYLSRLGTDHSRRTARSALQTVATLLGVETIDWEAVTYAELAMVRAGLGGFSVAWGNTCWTVVRQVVGEARRLGLVDQQLVDDVLALPRLRGTSRRLGRDVDDDEITALVDAVDDTSVKGLRDGAVLALLLGGLRCSETIGIEVPDVDPVTGRLTVRSGKGRKHREVPLGAVQQRLLGEWLTVHPHTGPILRSVDRWDRIGEQLSARGVRLALTGLCDRAGIPALSPHAVRAHQITSIICNGDVFLAQLYAGHSELSTTQRYDRRDIQSLETVVASISPMSSHRLRLVTEQIVKRNEDPTQPSVASSTTASRSRSSNSRSRSDSTKIASGPSGAIAT